MARHHSYSKRSRESRKAMAGDADAAMNYLTDDGAADDWQPGADQPNPEPPASR